MMIILVWMLFPGVWAVWGPPQVAAHRGSSLSVSCSYQPGYEHHAKVWCKSRFFSLFCSYMAQTDGSEAAVMRGRVSIRDNHTELTFTVTMSDVTPGDAGRYYCGAVQLLRHNQWHGTEVLISEVVAATVEASNVRTLTETTPSPTSSAEPPALSQLDITLLLLFLSVKLPVILALLCGAVWLRKRHRENLKQTETPSSTGEGGSPTPRQRQPDPPTALQHPAVPLPGLSHQNRSAPGSSHPVKPQPLLVPPKLHKGRVGVC